MPKKQKDSEFVKQLRKACKDAHAIARNKGWYESERKPAELMMLMVSEIAEAMEEVRNDKPPLYAITTDGIRVPATQTLGKEMLSKGAKPEGEAIELADLVIRLFDYCGYRGLDLGRAIEMKMAYNKTRAHRHGGKKF